MKRVQLWYYKRPPTDREEIMFERAEAVVVGYPNTLAEWIARLRGRGVKVLPYVSVYKAPQLAAVQESEDWQSGSPAHSECVANPFWQAVATDCHPEWIARDEHGKLRRPFENDAYAAGWNETSPLVPAYRQACIRGVRDLLAQGYDGVFLDNVKIKGRPAHAGLGGPEDVADAMRSLVADVGREVRPMMFTMNGAPDSAFASLLDACCIESFLFSWAWDLSFFTGQSWPETWRQYASRAWRPGGGPQPCALGYLGFSGRSLREDAYALLACAWILGMAVADAGTALNPGLLASFARRNRFQGGLSTALLFQARPADGHWLEEFYRIDLGDPVEDARICGASVGRMLNEREDLLDPGGCLVRRFERGACVFNPTPRPMEVRLPDWKGIAYEAACGVEIEPQDSALPLHVAPFCGRVLEKVDGPAERG